MNKLYKVANALFDCSFETISIDIDSSRFSHICKQEFYWKRIVISILCIVTYILTALSSIYAGEEIEVIDLRQSRRLDCEPLKAVIKP